MARVTERVEARESNRRRGRRHPRMAERPRLRLCRRRRLARRSAVPLLWPERHHFRRLPPPLTISCLRRFIQARRRRCHRHQQKALDCRLHRARRPSPTRHLQRGPSCPRQHRWGRSRAGRRHLFLRSSPPTPTHLARKLPHARPQGMRSSTGCVVLIRVEGVLLALNSPHQPMTRHRSVSRFGVS